MTKKGFIERTPGERERDGRLSLVDKKLEIMLGHLERMERSAASSKHYGSAENFSQLTRMVADIRRDMRRQY